MRIHLKNVSPKIHGMITEHKASHDHENLDQTVSCLIEEAMRRFDDADMHYDQTKLIQTYHKELDKMRASNERLRLDNAELFKRLEVAGLD